MNIQAIEYYLPEGCLTNERIAQEFPEWSIEKIAQKTGIYSRPIAFKDELSSDLAVSAALKLFDQDIMQSDKIDFLLFCTETPDYILPATACILQERLGLSKNIGAFDFNLGCSGYVFGLLTAKSLVKAKSASNVLLLTGDTYSKLIDRNDKSCRALFGDAASATLISEKTGIAKIGEFCYGSDGSGYSNLMVKHGSFRAGLCSENADACKATLYMDGTEIFKFTGRVLPKLVQATLDKNKLRMKDVDLFVFHQANKYMLDFVRDSMGIAEDRFYVNLADTGNTVSSSIPIALSRACNEKKIQKGTCVLTAGFGVGYSYGATVLWF